MESDISAEIMLNADIQQEKDACKELMLKNNSGGDSGQQIGYKSAIWYDNQLSSPAPNNSVLASCYRTEMG